MFIHKLLLSSLIITFISFSLFSFAATQPNKVVSPATSFELYQQAIDTKNSKTSCQQLTKLLKQKNIHLTSVIRLRYTERCKRNPNWVSLIQSESFSWLRRFWIRSWFDWSMKNKKYKKALDIYWIHKKVLDINKKDFEAMALGALKQKLSRKNRKKLTRELEKQSPRFIKKPSRRLYLKVARDYRNNRQFNKALTYYRRVLNDSKRSLLERWRGFQGARYTYKLERWSRMKKYIRASKQWAHFLTKKYKRSKRLTRLHHDANIEYIRTLWTERGQKEALKVLLRLEKELTGRYSLQQVYWLKGRMAEEREDYQKAIHWLERASKEKSLSQRDEDRILWFLSWNQRREKQYAKAQKNLARLSQSPEVTFFSKTKYLYWQAKNLESMGKKSESQDALERLADLDLYGYYGALAHRDLKSPFPEPPSNKLSQEDILSFLSKQDRKILANLIQLNELEIAEGFIDAKVLPKRSWDEDDWVHYLALLQKAGAYRKFFIKYHGMKPKYQLHVLEEHPYLLHPEPFKDIVENTAKKTLVSSALIYSIMKQESGFDVRARSHADAFGLLQLIPQVAKKVARTVPDVNYKEPYDLFKPRVIIPLGANNLKQLFSRFNSNFIISVASYNASEKAVRSWVKSRFNGDPVTFIEDIPYEETKGYVKLVMRNYISYNRFATQKENFLFPEVCLQGLKEFQ